MLTLLTVAGATLIFHYGTKMLIRSATPKVAFERPAAGSDPTYADLRAWLSRPGAELADARWVPDGGVAPATNPSGAATFYVHPTTYLAADRWNAPLRPAGQAEVNLRLFLKSQASAFGAVSQVWAPRYRQAAYGAFLLDSANAKSALDLAYGDVRAAFDQFLRELPEETPVILAGHSQGALHLTRLLAERRTALGDRLVAAYVVGWPVGAKADLPAMGVPACSSADQTGCLLSWQSFGEPANARLVTDAWVGTKGLDGAKRTRAEIVCVNPLTGTLGGSADSKANLGTLVPDRTLTKASLLRGAVSARCDNGFLKIGGDVPTYFPPPLLGNNFHVYDYALFWANVRADAERRLAAWRAR